MKALEGWLGERDEAQHERVRQFSERAPLNGELRLDDWAAGWDRGRDPALAAGSRAHLDEFFAMLLDLERTLSARQRAIARLRGLVRDFDMLAAAR